MTWLTRSPRLWDAVFEPQPERTRFLVRLAAARRARRVLDIGCATGTLAASLVERGLDVTGVDVNPRFVAAARRKCPDARFEVGDMRAFRLRARFDLVLCLGTTLAYATSTADVLETLGNLRRHLVPGGTLVLDVVNAIAFAGPHPFVEERRHAHTFDGAALDAVVRHRLLRREQCLTEQVTWTHGGRVRRDAEQRQRLFFPRELEHLIHSVGLEHVSLRSAWAAEPRDLGGRRLIAIARRAG